MNYLDIRNGDSTAGRHQPTGAYNTEFKHFVLFELARCLYALKECFKGHRIDFRT